MWEANGLNGLAGILGGGRIFRKHDDPKGTSLPSKPTQLGWVGRGQEEPRGGWERSGWARNDRINGDQSFGCIATRVSYAGQARHTCGSHDSSDAVCHCFRDEFGKVDPEISLE